MFSQATVLGDISGPISFLVGPGAVSMSGGEVGIKHNIVHSIFSNIVNVYKGADLTFIINANAQEVKVETML